MAAVVLRDVGWRFVPPELSGMVSKGLGAALVLTLLAVMWRHAPRTPWLIWPVAYGAWSAAQTVLCAIGYVIAPWPVPPGVGICSARLDFDLGALALVAVAVFALRASPVTSYSTQGKD